uniref:Uncharacterized protein n=1 Tax=Anser brachyrhynchus TaxID=132585 RepID=A0A8B9BRT2_9AVES
AEEGRKREAAAWQEADKGSALAPAAEVLLLPSWRPAGCRGHGFPSPASRPTAAEQCLACSHLSSGSFPLLFFFFFFNSRFNASLEKISSFLHTLG